jgi:hypothetical protein
MYLIERYLADIAWEISKKNKRQAIIPIRGILKVMNASFINKG